MIARNFLPVLFVLLLLDSGNSVSCDGRTMVTTNCRNLSFENCNQFFAAQAGDVNGRLCGTEDVECTSVRECQCLENGINNVCLYSSLKEGLFLPPHGALAVAMVLLAIAAALLLSRKHFKR